VDQPQAPEQGGWTRQAASARIREYFEALDRADVAGAVACFASRATLTCESDGTHLRGVDEIRAFFEQICGESLGMTHELLNVVIDVEGRKAAAELTYRDKLVDGREYDMRNCNFFDFDEDGRFARVHFWLGSPLV
jgi:ketosteroid isomerase-like protein